VAVPIPTREWPLRPQRRLRGALLLLLVLLVLLWLLLLLRRTRNDHCQLWIRIAAVAQLTESRTWTREAEEARGVVKPVTNEHPQHALGTSCGAQAKRLHPRFSAGYFKKNWICWLSRKASKGSVGCTRRTVTLIIRRLGQSHRVSRV